MYIEHDLEKRKLNPDLALYEPGMAPCERMALLREKEAAQFEKEERIKAECSALNQLIGERAARDEMAAFDFSDRIGEDDEFPSMADLMSEKAAAKDKRAFDFSSAGDEGASDE